MSQGPALRASTGMVILQLALDLADARRAAAIAKEAVWAGFDWIEVGTPLIKGAGMSAVRLMRRRFPGVTIVADMKTMDAGRAECEMAVAAGADVVTCLGLARDRTLIEAARAAHSHGARMMIDLINHPNITRRAEQARSLGADYLLVHVGKDEQLEGRDPLRDVGRVVARTDVPIAVAGGLNLAKSRQAVRKGASIVVIGEAVTSAEDVFESCSRYVRALRKRT